MRGEPDPDWYIDHVLFYAEPGVASVIRVDEVTHWQAWWRSQARAIGAQWPGLAARAVRQGFTLTSAQANELGVVRSTARGLVVRRQWSSPVRGAVSLVGEGALCADQPDRWTAERRRHALRSAAMALTNRGHVVTGNSAAVLRGLPVYSLPPAPELTVPLGRTVRRQGARVADLPATDLAAWWGIPCTGPARTVVDIARAHRRSGVVVADSALRTKQVTCDQLLVALDRAAGWPGVTQAREVVALADPRAESPLESILRLAVHDCGLPTPDLQVEIAAPGRRRPYRVDMLWREQRLIVEADGRTKYADPDRPDEDPLWAEKKREVALGRLGFRVERILWSDVVMTWPATYALLARALGQ